MATGLKDVYDITVAGGGNGLLIDKLTAAKIPTRLITSFERDINIIKEVRAMFELARLIRELRPDVVHLNSSKAGGTGAFVARLLGVPCIVFTAHGWPFYEKRSMLVRITIWFFSYLTTLLAHRTIVVSEHDFHGARMWGLERKLALVHTALPQFTLKDRNEARTILFPAPIMNAHKNDVWIVSTAEHTHNKNLMLILDAMIRLDGAFRERLFLTFMGDGELRDTLETAVRERGLDSHVYFTGFIDNARTFLSAFDVFLIPSLKEGFPYGLLEAGAAGLAVVASKVGGIPEIVTHGVTGILVNPLKPDDLAEAITRLVTDTQGRNSMGNSLKQHVIQNFRLENMLEKTKVLYER